MAEIVVSAQGRTDRGKNAARRLRRSGFVPAVIYGGKGDNLAVAVDPKSLHKVLRSEAGRNTILKLDIAGHGAANAILKSWQVEVDVHVVEVKEEAAPAAAAAAPVAEGEAAASSAEPEIIKKGKKEEEEPAAQ